MARHSTLVSQVCRLKPYPGATASSLSIGAALIWREGGPFTLSYGLLPDGPFDGRPLVDQLSGPWDQLRHVGSRRDLLWQHNCFEAFLALPGQQAYWELNVAPSGDWNLYRFSGYRQGGEPEPNAVAPSVSLQRVARGLRCTIELDPNGFWPSSLVPEIALTTVVEQRDGALSYWALSHPGEQADFHDRRGFLVP